MELPVTKLGELLKCSPLVLDSMERVMKLNIKVDVLLGDFDFDANYYKEHQHPIEIVHTPDQNKTDLEKLLITFMKEKLLR
jgi:thiamine pyrophosphokinase